MRSWHPDLSSEEADAAVELIEATAARGLRGVANKDCRERAVAQVRATRSRSSGGHAWWESLDDAAREAAVATARSELSAIGDDDPDANVLISRAIRCSGFYDRQVAS